MNRRKKWNFLPALAEHSKEASIGPVQPVVFLYCCSPYACITMDSVCPSGVSSAPF